MEDLAKYILLLLLALPFVAIATDALGKTHGLMIKVVIAVTAMSWLLAFGMGGLHQRPNVANIFIWAFFAWPILLLVAKGFNPTLPWRSMWFSVPMMSWYVTNVSMQFYYPTRGGGGGLGRWLALVAGWLYMVIPFALMSGVFVSVRVIIRRIRGECAKGE